MKLKLNKACKYIIYSHKTFSLMLSWPPKVRIDHGRSFVSFSFRQIEIHAFDYEFSFSTRARRKWTEFYKRIGGFETVRGVGPIIISYGQPHLEETTVCNFCFEETSEVGDVSCCPNCGCVEGETQSITLEEYEECHP